MDPGGNGSVMNPRGKCIVNIRVNDKNNSIAEVLSDNDGSVLHSYEKGDNAVDKIHEWSFQNISISFDPPKWELCVTITNSHSISCFSNIEGGKLIKGKHV